jgi:YaiO family outer membrane protein
MGRIHAWEGRYDEGRVELQQVLRAEPGHLDGRVALVDLELWSDHPRAALALCDEGLALRPAQPLLLFRKARAQKALGAYPAALETAKQSLVADPGLYEARQLIENLAELSQRSKVSLTQTYDHFDRTFAPWRMTSLGLAHRFDAGSLIGRVNRASRFGDTGSQLEVDAYPRWKDGTYFYLNAGFSDSGLFPHRRYGGEIYRSFPRGIEGSLGFRHLRFTASTVTIYTGSLGKYWGDYLFSLRANATPSSIGSSKSGSIAVRRYFGDGENHLTLSLGSGVSPDQPNPNAEILNLRSRKASLAAQGWIHRRLILSGSLAYEKQELGQGVERAQATFGAGLEWRF